MKEADTYPGERNAVAMLDFVNERANIKPRRSLSKATSSNIRDARVADVTMLELTESAFDATVSDPRRDVLVNFCVPWSDRCIAYAEEYMRIARAFEEDGDVLIVTVNVEKVRIGAALAAAARSACCRVPQTGPLPSAPARRSRSWRNAWGSPRTPRYGSSRAVVRGRTPLLSHSRGRGCRCVRRERQG